MSISNYPKGFADGVNIRGIPILSLYPGAVFWVDSVNGSNGNKGTFDRPFATCDYAVGRCTTNRGDLIIAKAGHVELISAANSLALDVAGIGIVFLGSGSNKATLHFTATNGNVAVSASNVTLVNPRLLVGIDAVIAGINVAAADFQMYGVEDYDVAGKAANIMVLTTAAANRMVIKGYSYFPSTTGAQKTNRIETIGALDSIVLTDININGNFSVSPINLGNAACTNIILEGIDANNTNAGPLPALTLHANTTGSAKNVRLRIASGTDYVSSVAKVQWADDCEGFNTDGYGGEPLGTSLGTGIEGKLDVVDGYFDVPTADAATDATIRDVVGRKTDAAVTVVAATKSLMAYLKGAINWLTVGVADATSNASAADVIGNKTDAQVVAVGTTKSIIAYLKGLIVNTIVSAADTTNNIAINDTVGNKTDAAVTAVGTTKSIIAYLKGVINWLTVGVADATSNASAADVVGNKTDASVYVPGTTKSITAYAKGISDLQERVVASATAVMVNSDVLFTITGGPILVEGLVSICITNNDATASTVLYQSSPTVGSAQSLAAASASLASKLAGTSLSLLGTGYATPVEVNNQGANLGMTAPMVVPAGTIIVQVGVGSTTGTWKHYLRYRPLAVGVSVT